MRIYAKEWKSYMQRHEKAFEYIDSLFNASRTGNWHNFPLAMDDSLFIFALPIDVFFLAYFFYVIIWQNVMQESEST